MNRDEKRRLYEALSAPLPAAAVQRTDGAVTGRGYNTTGYGYIWIASRLTEVLGLGNWLTKQTFTVRTTTSSKGRTIFEATCELVLQFGEWQEGSFVPYCEVHGTGGHNSPIEADARKGSYTNAFKKAAGMAGVGKAAFEKSIDDDNEPAADWEPSSSSPPSASRTAHERTQSSSPSAVIEGGFGDRNRLTSKQLAALWALARKLDVDKVAFRNRVKERFGCVVEFLDRQAASTLIGELSAKLGNGHARHVEHDAEGVM